MSEQFETISQLTDHFIKTAEKFIGAHENGPQHSLLLAVYNANKPAGEYEMTKTDPWCAAFIGAVSACAGTMKSVPLSASCERLKYLITSCGGYAVNTPQMGDIFFRGNQHTGIVKSVIGKSFTSIEGNYNDSVCEVSHDFVGLEFYRPAWSKSIGQSTDYAIDITPSEGIMWEKYRDFYHELTPAFQRQIRELPLLYRGCCGIYVKIAQKYLGISEDGDFGECTESNLKLYQKNKQLEVDGQIGKQTWSSFFV